MNNAIDNNSFEPIDITTIVDDVDYSSNEPPVSEFRSFGLIFYAEENTNDWSFSKYPPIFSTVIDFPPNMIITENRLLQMLFIKVRAAVDSGYLNTHYKNVDEICYEYNEHFKKFKVCFDCSKGYTEWLFGNLSKASKVQLCYKTEMNQSYFG